MKRYVLPYICVNQRKINTISLWKIDGDLTMYTFFIIGNLVRNYQVPLDFCLTFVQ